MDMKPKTLLQRMFEFARTELERRARANDHEARTPRRHASEPLAPARARQRALETRDEVRDPSAREPVTSHGLEAARAYEGAGLTLRWSIREADVERAQRLVEGSSVLCLRVVSFSPARDDVVREVRDRPGIELRGECELAEAPERAVVALGLRAGERFVSIAHHVV